MTPSSAARVQDSLRAATAEELAVDTPETGSPIGVPEFGFELGLDEVYAGVEFE